MSRVGSSAQTKAMKQVAGKMERRTRPVPRDGPPSPSSALISTPPTQRLLARGERLTELLKQPQFSPLSMEEQVCVIFAGTRGYLDKVATKDIGRYEAELLRHLHGDKAKLLEKHPHRAEALRRVRGGGPNWPRRWKPSPRGSPVKARGKG